VELEFILRELNPVHDLEGYSSSNSALEHLQAYALGTAKSFLRGGVFGAVVGAGLSMITDYDTASAALVGATVFTMADMGQFKWRYVIPLWRDL
jgi:hypothetical protein